MKLSRKIKMLILILLSSSVYFIYDKTNYNNITYTAMGDGLVLGIDAYGRIDYSYSDYVKDYLKSINKLKNYSSDFVSEDMTIEKLYNTLLTDKKVYSNNKNLTINTILRETDYLTITIGLNDLLYKINLNDDLTEKDIEKILIEIEENFNNLINEIRKVYSNDIYIIGYYEASDDKKVNLAIKKLNKIYSKNKHVIYISTMLISENRNIFLPNPSKYYPNYKGYQAISTKIINKISKKLEK